MHISVKSPRWSCYLLREVPHVDMTQDLLLLSHYRSHKKLAIIPFFYPISLNLMNKKPEILPASWDIPSPKLASDNPGYNIPSQFPLTQRNEDIQAVFCFFTCHVHILEKGW